jgi:RND family efflux transporter MFP subunit
MKSKSFVLSIFTIGLALTWGMTSCGSNAKDELAHGHDHAHEHNHEGHEGHNHGGEEITVEPEIAERFGVKTETAKPGTFNEIIKVSGQILETTDGSGVVSAPTAGIVHFTGGIQAGKQVSQGMTIATVSAQNMSGGDANRAQLAALNAAKAEMERLKPLHDNGIVSTAEYNRAVAAYETARASYSPSAASGRAASPINGVITDILVSQGQYVEAGAPIATISASQKLTLRADLPDRYYSLRSSITGANVQPNYSDQVIDLSTLGASLISGAGKSSSQPGYIPIYFTFNNDGTFIPGSMVEVYLIGASRDNVISVPVTALSEQQGDHFVYIKLDEEGYVKAPVKLGTRDGVRVEILDGVHAGDQVVVQGTTTVRLAETSSVVPEGHSHNH